VLPVPSVVLLVKSTVNNIVHSEVACVFWHTPQGSLPDRQQGPAAESAVLPAAHICCHSTMPVCEQTVALCASNPCRTAERNAQSLLYAVAD
jgi:hypothetical protein